MKRLVWLAIALTLTAAVITIIWCMRQVGTPYLLDRSQKIASVSDWTVLNDAGATKEPGTTCYYWLNPTELLHFRVAEDGRQAFRLKADGSQTETEISGVQLPQDAAPLQVSDDGSLLLWLTGGDHRYVHPRITVLGSPSDRAFTGLPASFPILWPPHVPRFRATWSARGDHYQIVSRYDEVQHDLTVYHGHGPSHYVIGPEPLQDPAQHDLFTRLFAGSQTALGMSLLEPFNEFRLNYVIPPRSVSTTEHTLRIGSNRGVTIFSPSQDPDRIFFEEARQVQDPLPTWVYARLSWLRPSESRERRVLVVADLNTGYRKELACYEKRVPAARHRPESTVQDVKWSPDGKRLSFVFGQNLYTMPIE